MLKSEIRGRLDVMTPLGSLCSSGVLIDAPGTGFARMRTLKCAALVLLVEGGGRYRDASGVDERLRSGDCLSIPEGCPHCYGPEAGDRWTEIFFTFRGTVFDAWFPPRAARVRGLGDGTRWLPRWLKIHRMRATSPEESVRVLAELHLLLNDVMRVERARPSDADRLEQTRQLVESWPPGTVPDWARLARMCHCSYETWRKWFREVYGVPPARYRREALMRLAGELLRRTELTNERLAEHFGCTDAFHFSKLFKSVHGTGPAEWRKSRR